MAPTILDQLLQTDCKKIIYGSTSFDRSNVVDQKKEEKIKASEQTSYVASEQILTAFD